MWQRLLDIWKYSTNTQKPNCSPALLNSLILIRIFSFLELKDLKNCRLVCKEWFHNSESRFRNHSRIKLNLISTKKNKSFHRRGDINPHDCLSTNFDEFIERYTRNSQLSSIAVCLPVPGGDGEIVEFFQKYILSANILRNLKCLTISGVGLCLPSCFDVPLYTLENLEELEILNRTDIWLNGRQLNLKKLILKAPISFLGGKNHHFPAQLVWLDEFVNIGKMKILKIGKDVDLIVNMGTGDNLEFTEVELCTSRIVRWGTSNWNIKNLTLDLRRTLSTRNTTMTIDEVCFISNHQMETIENIKFLPPAIKKLSIKSTEGKIVQLKGDGV